MINSEFNQDSPQVKSAIKDGVAPQLKSFKSTGLDWTDGILETLFSHSTLNNCGANKIYCKTLAMEQNRNVWMQCCANSTKSDETDKTS